MTHPYKLALALLWLAALVTVPARSGWDPKQEATEEREARETVARFQKEDPDLKEFFDKAYGYAVFPTVGKAGMGFGGAYGKGLVFQGGQVVGTTSVTQLTMGLQMGAQAYSEIIFFKDQKTLDDFKQGHFELGAQASAVLVKKGASTNKDYDSGVAVFTLPKGGMMAEASVGGQKFSFEPR